MEHYLEKYLQLLEKKLERGNLQAWKNADYEFIGEDISEKTGIKVSSSTLKRIFRKVKTDENYQPQAATLLAMAKYLEFESWEHFKSSIGEEKKPETGIGKDKRKGVKSFVGAAILLVMLITAFIIFGIKQSQTVTGEIYLNSDDTVVVAPQTVRFTYDLGQNISADSFVIAPSTYKSDPLSNTKGEYSYTYAVPGYYACQLRNKGGIIAEKNILVVSNGWRSAIVKDNDRTEYQPVKFGLFASGTSKMYVSPEELRAIDSSVFNKEFYLEYKEVRDYSISGDNLSFETSVKNVPEEGGMGCRKITVDLLGKQGRIRLDFFHQECISETSHLYFGNIRKNIKHNDIPGFWQNLSGWHKIGINSRNQHIAISFDGTVVYETSYENKIGDIYSIIYGFEGCGSVDYIRMTDANRNLSYSEEFN